MCGECAALPIRHLGLFQFRHAAVPLVASAHHRVLFLNSA
jgi:hypothetical protein